MFNEIISKLISHHKYHSLNGSNIYTEVPKDLDHEKLENGSAKRLILFLLRRHWRLTISAALPKRNANTKTDDLKEAHPKTYFSYTKASNWNMLSRRHCIDYSEQERWFLHSM
jgi:hypothetical protein